MYEINERWKEKCVVRLTLKKCNFLSGEKCTFKNNLITIIIIVGRREKNTHTHTHIRTLIK